MKYLYIQENKDWNFDNKFKYGFTTNPKIRNISEQHSHKSSYIALYECEETPNYIYGFKEYDKIISSLRNTDNTDIIQTELDFNIDLNLFKEIKKYLVNDGGGTEFIYSIEGIELLDLIFTTVFNIIGITIRKLSKNELNDINLINNNNSTIINTSIISKPNTIKLRDYQTNIIKYGITSIINNHKFYLDLATGAGKSTIIYYILNNIILKNIDIYYTIIIFTPRINISVQNINDKYRNILKKKFNVYDNISIKKQLKTFNNSAYNIISCCIQSHEFIFDKIITKFDIKNIIIWFDEAHYTIENWISSSITNYYKKFYLNDNERIIYRLFTSASPNKSIVSHNYDIFGELYSPITVRQLIKDKWLSPIKAHIMDFDDIKYDIDDDEINYDNNHYYYYTNTILNTFQKLNKTIGLNFHNSCKNATFAFFSHYTKFINNKTNIKPYLLISDTNIYDKLDSNYKYLLNFQDFHNEPNNAIAYIVNMYKMGYDNPKIDFLSFGDPKLSNKDIIQSIGRGIRSDGADINGKNKSKINDIIIPIYTTNETDDDYIKFSKIREILQYLIYDVGINIENITIKKNSQKFYIQNSTFIQSYDELLLQENKIIANIIKWDIEPTAEKWTISKIITHLMNNKIHNYNSYLEYISLQENKELNLPSDLFKTYSNFNFNDTYKLSPYYTRDECIKTIKTYKNDFIDNDEIDKENNNDIIEFLHNKDAKIPNCILWYYYGGSIKDFILFI